MFSDIKLQLYYASKALPNALYTISPGVLAGACLLLEPYLPGIAFLAPVVAGGSLYLGAQPGALNRLPERFRIRMSGWLQKRAALPEMLKGLPGEDSYLRKLDAAIDQMWQMASNKSAAETMDQAAWAIDLQFHWADRLVSLMPKLQTVGDSAEYIIKLDTAIDVFREASRSGLSADALVAQAKEIDDLISLVDQKITEVANTTNQATAQEGLNELFRVKKEILDGLSSRQQAEQDATQMINQIKN